MISLPSCAASGLVSSISSLNKPNRFCTVQYQAEHISCKNLNSRSGRAVIIHCQQSTAVNMASSVNNSTCDQAIQCSSFRSSLGVFMSRAVAFHSADRCMTSDFRLHASHTAFMNCSWSTSVEMSCIVKMPATSPAYLLLKFNKLTNFESLLTHRGRFSSIVELRAAE